MTAQEIFDKATGLKMAGKFAEAEQQYRLLNDAFSQNLLVNHALGQILISMDRKDEALQFLQSAMKIALETDTPGATKDQITTDIASIMFPAPSYYDAIDRVASKLTPRGYLEIGVNTGESLALIKPPTLAIGIDPAPRVAGVAENASLYVMTSDDFFDGGHLARNHPDFKLDLAFIDGLHSFHQVIKDFINVEKNAAPSSIILIHDLYPPTRWAATPEHNGGFWAGDGWKLFFFLKKFRPDLDIAVLGAPPTGLTVIRRLSPDNHVLESALPSIMEDADDMDYSIFKYCIRPELKVANSIDELVDFSSGQGWV